MPAPARATALLSARSPDSRRRRDPDTEPIALVATDGFADPPAEPSTRAQRHARRGARTGAGDEVVATDLPSHRLVRAGDGVLQVPSGLAGARVSPPLLAVGGAAIVVVVAVLSVVFGLIGGENEAEPVPTRPVSGTSASPMADGRPPGSVGQAGGAAVAPADPAATPGSAGGGAAPAGAAPGPVAGAPAAPDLVVHVVGEVGRPGVVTIPAGSRVKDALEKAGGPSRKAVLTGLNLARPVVDGEQITVPDKAGAPIPINTLAPPSAAAGVPAGPQPLVDLNAADQPTLESLPGVGPVMAARIIEWRTANGRFTAVDQLGEVKGVGEKTLEALRPRVRV
ncbi:ComEA family DNA-binding protein [Mobilicoccus caccae]|uniref:Helix-hairpin-helix DNA-binding motif class 1 domain-containing protein n=1 Tax=Mobilicoccus caccae TaxID=1859295 RepID=A0ABQ6IND6_9MICO|nr:ComEA family DNA-binding protein [Mobilicoccus caccae]GMA39251.1 hypothetical protein GCM10025883_12960 [Mobilicoccus caccae]